MEAVAGITIAGGIVVPMPATRVCSRCREEKPRADFSPTRHNASGLAYYCRVCFAAIRRERYQENHGSKDRQRRKHDSEAAAVPPLEREPLPVVSSRVDGDGRRWVMLR